MISNHVNHVNPAYHTSNRPAGSGTNANASAYSTVISDSLVKVILILLSGLLLANSVLFYKMWDLEAKLGSPLSNLEEVLFEATREHGASMDRTTWLKILQRQEAAHQLELQKWHDLLGTAASLLKQVYFTHCLKTPNMSHLNFWICAFPTNFCHIESDLSGNTVWPQASGFQKLVKLDHFWPLMNFCPFKM